MVQVFITIDTELSMAAPRLDAAGVRAALDRDVFGRTRAGEFGIGFQLDRFREHGLKATFFIESLFAEAAGPDGLRRIVEPVIGAGQDAQLHVHPEWLAHCAEGPLPGRTGQHLWQFDEDEQAVLIAAGKRNLEQAGAGAVVAFRAGNYGADRATLRALARTGIRVDSSHNATSRDSRLAQQTDLAGPAEIDGVWELPVTTFEDWPGHRRHAQLTAVSSAELAAMLDQAEVNGHVAFVIVSHGFELLNAARTGPDPTVVRRFEALCRFLADRRDRLPTAHVASWIPPAAGAPARPLRSHALRTAGRYVEQSLRRRHG